MSLSELAPISAAKAAFVSERGGFVKRSSVLFHMESMMSCNRTPPSVEGVMLFGKDWETTTLLFSVVKSDLLLADNHHGVEMLNVM